MSWQHFTLLIDIYKFRCGTSEFNFSHSFKRSRSHRAASIPWPTPSSVDTSNWRWRSSILASVNGFAIVDSSSGTAALTWTFAVHRVITQTTCSWRQPKHDIFRTQTTVRQFRRALRPAHFNAIINITKNNLRFKWWTWKFTILVEVSSCSHWGALVNVC